MKICCSKQMKSLDEKSIKDYGIPAIVLMENAGASAAREIEKSYEKEKSISVICGTGNNGGDGFVIARHMINKGWKVEVFLCGDENKLKNEALTNYDILRKMTDKTYNINENNLNMLEDKLRNAPVIVDALLGTGFAGKLRELYRKIIEIINSNNSSIVSVDIPSGLNADTGFFEDVCINADITITFQLAKVGLIINHGPERCGKLIIADISIPQKLIRNEYISMNLTDESLVKGHIYKRSLNTHKGSYGRILVIAGSKGMTGAGLMSARAALKSGAGIVVLGVPESLQQIVSSQTLEIITKTFYDNETGLFTKENAKEIIEAAKQNDCLLIGPGISSNDDTFYIIKEVIKNCRIPIVIDADGLNALARDTDILMQKNSQIIVTPHPGEMARLLNCSISDVQEDRIGSAVSFSKKYGVVTILKGYRTIAALPNEEVYINPTGNPGMATAGSGDVLAGIIAGFIGQKISPEIAAISGVYIHGKAGDMAAEKIGEHGLTASDIINYIAHTIKNITGN